MEKILITGASGLIGNAVVEQLAINGSAEIFAVTSGRKQHSFPEGVHTVTADFLNPVRRGEILREIRPDLILHLAWGLEDSDFKMSSSNLDWLNASLDFLVEYGKMGGSRFVFAGSSSEYGLVAGKCGETVRGNPVHLYGRCKQAFTEIGGMYCKEKGISFASIRYFPLYGEEDIRPKGIIPYAITQFMNRQEALCMAPENIWEFVYIKDAAEATLSILKKEFEGIVNVTSGAGIRIRDVFQTIAREMDCEYLLKIRESCEPGSTLLGDASILQTQVGYRCRTSLEDGLAKTISWWRKQVNDNSKV